MAFNHGCAIRVNTEILLVVSELLYLSAVKRFKVEEENYEIMKLPDAALRKEENVIIVRNQDHTYAAFSKHASVE